MGVIASWDEGIRREVAMGCRLSVGCCDPRPQTVDPKGSADEGPGARHHDENRELARSEHISPCASPIKISHLSRLSTVDEDSEREYSSTSLGDGRGASFRPKARKRAAAGSQPDHPPPPRKMERTWSSFIGL